MMTGIALVARDHRDARARMTLEPLGTGPPAVARIGKRHPEASPARRLERPGADVRGVRVRRALELGHGLDDEILAVRHRGEARDPDRETRALHLGAVRLDERLLRGMVLAQRLDRRSPVLMTDLDRGAVERGLGLAVELLAPRAKRSRVVIEKLLLFQPRVDGVPPDRER